MILETNGNKSGKNLESNDFMTIIKNQVEIQIRAGFAGYNGI